jgi:phospholipase/carboxylesterase
MTRTLAALLVAGGAALLPAGDGDVERLRRDVRSAFEKRDYARAASLGEDLAAREPASPGPAYDVACAYSRLGRAEAALRWLRAAAERGFSFTATARRDADLDPVRREPGFAEVIAAFERNGAAALERVKPLIDAAPLLVHVPRRLDPSRPAPLVVALHSFGGRAEEIASLWRRAAEAQGAILVAPRSHVRRGRGFDWGAMDQAEYAILRAVARARAAHAIDPARIVLTGFSQGGSMAFYVALRQPALFAGVVPVAGFYEERLNPLPTGRPGAFPRFFIMNGARDEAAPNNRQVARALEALGAAVELRVYNGVGHGFPPNPDPELRDALRFVLAGT